MRFLCNAVFLTTVIWVSALVTGQAVQAQNLKMGPLECLYDDGTVFKEDGKLACEPGQKIRAQISGLAAWEAAGTAEKPNVVSKLILTIEGYELTGLLGNIQPVVVDGEQKQYLQFDLRRTAENRKSWSSVLTRTNLLKARSMTFAVKIEGSNEFLGTSKMVFRVASLGRTLWMAGFLLAVGGVFIYLVKKGKLLREDGSPLANGKRRPFSLARTQMAFWFFVIMLGFIFLWMVTGAVDTLTASVLGLAGISAATGLSAVAIGGSDNYVETRDAQTLQTAIDTHEKALKAADQAIEKAGANVTEKHTQDRAAIKAKLDQAKTGLDWVNKDAQLGEFGRFLRDLFTSDGQAVFSRFQIIAWTLVLGIVFCHSVWTTLEMPAFSSTLLGLMGISGGTYVGFKFPQTPNA